MKKILECSNFGEDQVRGKEMFPHCHKVISYQLVARFKRKEKRNSLMTQWVKDPPVSLLWHRFDPWPGKFCIRSEKREREREKHVLIKSGKIKHIRISKVSNKKS